MASPVRTRASRHTLAVLGIWAAATALTFLLGRLGAQDTPATAWGPAAPDWATHMSFWDSGWYERIWREGYPSTLPVEANGTVAANAWAFMPLLPWLATPLTALGLGFYPAASLISLVASAATALLADAWLTPRVGARAGLWGVAFFLCGPCALVLQSAYAESLSLALLAGGFLLIERHRPVLATGPLVLACLARPLGAPLTLTLLLWAAWQWRSRGAAAGARAALPVVVTGTMTAAWPLAAWVVTGRPDAYTATETAWRGGSFLPFLQWPIAAGGWAGQHLALPLYAVSLLLIAAFLTWPALRTLGALPWLWCAAYLLYLLAAFDPTTSVIRILLPLVPAAWAAARALAGEDTQTPGSLRRPVAFLAACVGSQILWIAWLWDLGSVTIQHVP